MSIYDSSTWNGQLGANKIYNSTFNAYKLLGTVADRLKGLGSSLVDRFRVDVSGYEDKLVKTDFDILKSYVFDENDTDCLTPGEKVDPKQEFFKISQQRQISLYTPTKFLTKLAWMKEDAFNEFQSVVQADVRDTKKAYDYLIGMTAIGTMEAGSDNATDKGYAQKQTIKIGAAPAQDATKAEVEAYNRLAGQTIAKELDDILVKACDLGRDFNDYGFMKSYEKSDFTFVGNSEMINTILKIDLPQIFNNAGLDSDLKGEKIQAKYFGKLNSAVIAKSAVTANKYRALEEADYATGANAAVTHVYPGDYIPAGTTMVTSLNANGTAKTVASEIAVGEVYENDNTILGKFIHKEAIKYLTGMETESEFWNGKNLSTNRWLTWFFEKPKRSKSYPIITVRVSQS